MSTIWLSDRFAVSTRGLEGGFINYGMEHSTNEINQAGATSEDATDATVSPDEYDEDLGFPDDDMTMVTLGKFRD